MYVLEETVVSFPASDADGLAWRVRGLRNGAALVAANLNTIRDANAVLDGIATDWRELPARALEIRDSLANATRLLHNLRTRTQAFMR